MELESLCAQLKAACAERDFKRERARALEERLREQVTALEALRGEQAAGCSAAAPASAQSTRAACGAASARRPLHAAPRRTDHTMQRASRTRLASASGGDARLAPASGGDADAGGMIKPCEEENVVENGAEHLVGRRSARGPGNATRACVATDGGNSVLTDERTTLKEERKLLLRHLDELNRV